MEITDLKDLGDYRKSHHKHLLGDYLVTDIFFLVSHTVLHPYIKFESNRTVTHGDITSEMTSI